MCCCVMDRLAPELSKKRKTPKGDKEAGTTLLRNVGLQFPPTQLKSSAIEYSGCWKKLSEFQFVSLV